MAREQYGNTWWGQQWLLALTKIDLANRIPRGLSYARRGMVSEISIQPGKADATVKGSRPKPYSVSLSMDSFKQDQLSDFVDSLLEFPTILSRLLDGRLDPKVLEIAQANRINIFPQKAADMEMSCSCPDFAVPCKHLAATVYQICKDIDTNPFVLFDFRGIDLVALLKERDIHLDQVDNQVIDTYEAYLESRSAHQPLAYNYDMPALNLLPDCLEEHLALIEDQPSFYPYGNFKEIYAKSLKKISIKAQKVLKEKLELSSFFEKEGDHVIDAKEEVKWFLEDKELASQSASISQVWQIDHDKLNAYHPSVKSKYVLIRIALHCIAKGLIYPKIISYNKPFYIIWQPSLLQGQLAKIIYSIENIDRIYHTEDCSPELASDAVVELSFIITKLISRFYVAEKKGEAEFTEFFFKEKGNYFADLSESGVSAAIASWLKLYTFNLGEHYPVLSINESGESDFTVDIFIGNVENKMDVPLNLHEFVEAINNKQKLTHVYKDLDLLSRHMPRIGDYINGGGQESITYSAEEFPEFLFEIQPVLKLLKIKIDLPKSLKSLVKPKPSMRISDRAGESGGGMLTLGSMLQFEWKVSLGDNLITEQEFQELVTDANKLIKYKGQYIYISETDLKKLEKSLASSKSFSNVQLLQIALAEEYDGSPIQLTDNIKGLIEKLTTVDLIEPPENLKATFRPYQHRGYSWMYKNYKIGLGCIIADDMGLGKTLQVIALVAKLKEDQALKDMSALIVVPTSLIPNWQSEFKKFVPDLAVYTYYGANRKWSDREEESIVLTSYGVARADVKLLAKQKWLVKITDESQNIKNPNSLQTKAIKSISSEVSIAMSGTPVENKLLDYWSIMDYANKGLLGNKSNFSNEFANPISKDGDTQVLERFSKITAPFILRRMKTDKSIISDLPDKIIQDTYASLSPVQSALYKQVLEESLKAIEEMKEEDNKSLFKRQGLVLQMILVLKQICNHPSQWLKDGKHGPEDSGKLTLLVDLVSSIMQAEEKVLIFTQFREMGDIIKACLSDVLGLDSDWLHGGVSMVKRKEMVDSFQSLPHHKIMILSLKAGGTGLNLTAANHVIHYDLWWNPAVEAQATDRAFRIGQKKNVVVHRLITKHTFEEKINDLISAKKDLADMAVTSGEKWIGQMKDKELQEIFELS